MGKLGSPGYQLYTLPEGLFVIGSSSMDLLNRKSKEDIEEIFMNYLQDSEDGDVFMDHKINRSMIC